MPARWHTSAGRLPAGILAEAYAREPLKRKEIALDDGGRMFRGEIADGCRILVPSKHREPRDLSAANTRAQSETPADFNIRYGD